MTAHQGKNSPCGVSRLGQDEKASLFCRRASKADAALVCELLCEPNGTQDQAARESASSRESASYVSCFEKWGLVPPCPGELVACVEDLLASAFICQLCEAGGVPVGFMAFGHSPLVPSSLGSSLTIPASLAGDPDAKQICNTLHNQWLHEWPQWLRGRYHCAKRSLSQNQFHVSSLGFEQSAEPDLDLEVTSISSEMSSSLSPSASSFSRRPSFEDEDLSNAISSEIRLGDGNIVTPSNTLWLLLFVCKVGNPSSEIHSPCASEVARAMLQSSFASMYELQWVLRLYRPDCSAKCYTDPLAGLFPPLEEAASAEDDGPQTLRSRISLAGVGDANVGFCRRQTLLPVLRTRIAKIEDHDDLLELFDAQTMLQSSVYGEYFIAELIGSQNDESRCIVSEVDGRARGFAAFTTEVDLALLSTCFELSAFDFFVKPAYHDKIKATVMAQHSFAARGVNTDGMPSKSQCRETYTVAELCGSEGYTSLFEALRTEDGRISQAVLLAAFQRVRLSVTPAQATLWSEATGSGSMLTAASVVKALEVFSKLDLNQIEADALKVLNSWPAVSASIAAAQAAARRPQRMQSGFTFLGPDALTPSSLIIADAKRPPTNLSAGAAKSRFWGMFRTGEFVSVPLLLSKLQETDTAALSKEEAARVLLALHWWAGVPLGSLTATTTTVQLEAAFKQLSTTGLRHFAKEYGSRNCFKRLPRHHKNVFALTIFGMKQELYSQALDLLLPAFSLFPDKEYMIVLQPPCSGSAAACPLLSYFQLASRYTSSTLQYCLYILHRQSLMEPIRVQPITSKELQQATNIAASVGIQLAEFKHPGGVGTQPRSCSSMSDGKSSFEEEAASSDSEAKAFEGANADGLGGSEGTTQSAASPHPRVLVCLSGDSVIGVACVLKYNVAEVVTLQKSYPLSSHTLQRTAKLQQQVRRLREKLHNEQAKKHRMQCRFDALPPLPEGAFLDALEAKVMQGNTLLVHFTTNPIFAPLQNVILREVMRLTGSQLLHIAVSTQEPLPTVAVAAIPLLPLPDVSLRPEAGDLLALEESEVTCQREMSQELHQTCSVNLLAQSKSRFVFSPSCLSLRPWRVTSRVVFIGSCTTAFSAIKRLIWGTPEVKFVDVTLVSPSGIPRWQKLHEPLLSADGVDADLGLMLLIPRSFPCRHLLFDLHVRVVRRSIVRIDRRNKRVYLSCAPGSHACFTRSANESCVRSNEDASSPGDSKDAKARRPSDGKIDKECGQTFLTYDLLVLAGGMHDAALQQLGIRSWGLSCCRSSRTELKPALCRTNVLKEQPESQDHSGELRKVNGCISAADPQIHELLGESGKPGHITHVRPFLIPLRWNPLASAVVYGRSLDALCLVQGLIKRQVPPQKISVRYVGSTAADELIEVDEFSDEAPMGLQCLQLLRDMGIRVHTNLLLHDVVTESQGRLKGVLLKDAAPLAAAANEPPRQPQASSVRSGGAGPPAATYRSHEDTQQALQAAYQYLSDAWEQPDEGHGFAKSRSLTSLRSVQGSEGATSSSSTAAGASSNPPAPGEPKLLPCRLLLTADRQNIDWDILQAVQEAGLVYDGRMIVQHDFSTSDSSIYAAGSLAEFHRRHRPTRTTDLRLEKYCPDEVGFYLSIALGRRLMPLWLRSTLPPLEGAFFASALPDQRLLRPSQEIINIFSLPFMRWRCPPSEDIARYRLGLDSCTCSSNRCCAATCGEEEDRMAQLPRFSALLCRQGTLPGSLRYCRLSACCGCLAKVLQTLFEKSCGPAERASNLKHLPVGLRDQIRTDTLRLSWGSNVLNSVVGQRVWKSLKSTGGQICVLKWDTMTRVRSFQYLGPRPLQLLGLQQLLCFPISFLNKIVGKVQAGQVTDIMAFLCEKESWANAMLEPSFNTFLESRTQALRQYPEVMRALHDRLQFLRARNNLMETRKEQQCQALRSPEKAIEGHLSTIPFGSSWSEQRRAAQLKLSTDDADDQLHPLLEYDVQRQLIEYLRLTQQTQDRYTALRQYYIPSAEALESAAKARLDQLTTH
ncbi:hypothetical protein Efla_000500 [Eimeria flavescens]